MHLPTITACLSLPPLITAAYTNPWRGDYSRTQAAKGSARHDSLTIYNSNCPCERHNYKWCLQYAKYNVRDMLCYDVGQPSLGVSIYDPWVSADTPLECTVYREHGCQGEGVGWQSWKNNRECKEFGSKDGDKGVTWFHRSFRCKHVGWPEGNTTHGETTQEHIPNDKASQDNQKKQRALEKAMLAREAEHEKWKTVRKGRWLERNRIDDEENKRKDRERGWRC